MPRYGEAHHKRVPTPMKKRRHQRRHETPATPNSEAEDAEEEPPQAPAPQGVPDPYYPIYLPIDQAFKAKYIFHQRRGKTFQERVYVFLEHPVGWVCFVYHFSVYHGYIYKAIQSNRRDGSNEKVSVTSACPGIVLLFIHRW
ncbi:Potassium voltage-gated channel sub KQT member 1 [Homalodisca vitripennis]|nr:Potassium voltage-gated channel sub KQT member 1 [Homalodisca vitripennis]